MAAAYVQEGDFQRSAETYHDAMEIYREVVGEGNNPITYGLEQRLGDTTGMLNEILSSAGIDESQLQDLLSSLGYGDLLNSLNLNNKNKNKKNQGGTTTGQGDKANEAGNTEVSPTKQVHEELIDMEKLREIIYNATSNGMKEEL